MFVKISCEAIWSWAFILGRYLITASISVLLLWQSTGSRALGLPQLHVGSLLAAPRLWGTGSIVVAHGLCCPSACGIFPDQGSNSCLLHWQTDSLPLSCQGSPIFFYWMKDSLNSIMLYNFQKFHTCDFIYSQNNLFFLLPFYYPSPICSPRW